MTSKFLINIEKIKALAQNSSSEELEQIIYQHKKILYIEELFATIQYAEICFLTFIGFKIIENKFTIKKLYGNVKPPMILKLFGASSIFICGYKTLTNLHDMIFVEDSYNDDYVELLINYHCCSEEDFNECLGNIPNLSVCDH